ncbi:hypothetical protein, partial [Pseudomonas savastanoi]|uniref:hypothetical protein n=2 Tax=Pseudomonas savastanoi TaxID=29438 RepID=UPI0009BD2AE2
GVSRQPGTLGYLMQRELVAEVHPPDFSQHFHADHPVFSCSKSEQKQLNTWVSFQSAEQPLLGQFSVSGNRRSNCRILLIHFAHQKASVARDEYQTPSLLTGIAPLHWAHSGANNSTMACIFRDMGE